MVNQDQALIRTPGKGWESAFRDGAAVAVRFRNHAAVAQAMARVKGILAGLPVERSPRRAVIRQSFWVAGGGVGGPLYTRRRQIARLDGDLAGGTRGLQVLAQHPDVVPAISTLRVELDDALIRAIRGLDLGPELARKLVVRSTTRYRFLRYEALAHEPSGIGWHPDGNVLSALLTDAEGLIVIGGPGHFVRPDPQLGTLVMPGSVLARWSNMALLPTPHAVEIRSGQRPKFTAVAFWNFGTDGPVRKLVARLWADRPPHYVPRSTRYTTTNFPFSNEIQRMKEDDMNPNGDLRRFYHARDLTVDDGGRRRFRSLQELVYP